MTNPADARQAAQGESVLDGIVRELRAELPGLKAAKSESTLRDEAKWRPAPRDFAAVLRQGRAADAGARRIGIISEVKRGSPSKGKFARELNPVRTARGFRDAGAIAISVLTSRHFFATNADLSDIADALNDDEKDTGKVCPPLLRKEFHIDPYQVLQARALGADAYLLIVKTLDEGPLRQLIEAGEALQMTAFVEVNDEHELEIALRAGAKTIGINNRDLHTFREDLGTSERLRPLVPPEIPVVAASGVRTLHAMRRMKAANVDAVLVGEALSTVDDPAAKMRELNGDE